MSSKPPAVPPLCILCASRCCLETVARSRWAVRAPLTGWVLDATNRVSGAGGSQLAVAGSRLITEAWQLTWPPAALLSIRVMAVGLGWVVRGWAPGSAPVVGGEEDAHPGGGVSVEIGWGREVGIAAKHDLIQRDRHDQPVEMCGREQRVV